MALAPLPPALSGSTVSRRDLAVWLRVVEGQITTALVACPDEVRMRQLQGQAQLIADLIKKLDV